MTVQHIWEQTEIRCSAEYTGKKTKACKFKFFEGDTEVAVVEAKLSGVLTKSWNGKHKVRACKPEEASFPLTCKVFVDDVEKPEFQQDARVFAKTITIKAVNLVGGAAIPGAELEIRQLDPRGRASPSNKTRKTKDDGTYEHELVFPNTVTILWKRPWILSSWKDESTRKPEAKLDYGFVAKLVFPDPTVAPDPDPRLDPKGPKEHLQWVNLGPSSSAPANGAKITIRVGAKEPAKSAQGDRCWLVATFDANNSARDKPKGGHAPGEVVKLQAKLDSTKHATFELQLGYAGGDRIKVTVGGTADASDDEVTIVQWRKIFYETIGVDTMALEDVELDDGSTGKGLPAESLAWYTERLAALNVFYVPRRAVVIPAGDEPVKSCMLPAAYMGMTGSDKYVVGQADTRPDAWGPYGPTVVRITLCDRQFAGDPDATPHAHTFTLTSAKVQFNVEKEHNENLFERDMSSDGGDAIFPGEWVADIDAGANPEHPGVQGGEPRRGTCARTWFKAVNMSWLEIKLPSTISSWVGPLSTTHCPIRVSFKLRTAFEINGSAGSGRQMLVYRPTLPKVLACTLSHELGHAMGLVVYRSGPHKKPPPAGIEAPKTLPDGGAYIGHGHTGTHCANGLSEEHKKLDSYQNREGVCVMYGGANLDAEPARDAYCADCIVQGRARRLHDITWDWSKRKSGDL